MRGSPTHPGRSESAVDGQGCKRSCEFNASRCSLGFRAVRREDRAIPLGANEDAHPESFASRQFVSSCVFECETAHRNLCLQISRIDELEAYGEPGHRGHAALADLMAVRAGQLQNDGDGAVFGNHRKGVVEAKLKARMLEDERGVNQRNRLDDRRFSSEIGAVQFEAGKRRESLADRSEIACVQVDANDPGCNRGVDSFQSVAACDAQNSDRARPAKAKSFGEEIGERSGLPHRSRGHVLFVIR